MSPNQRAQRLVPGGGRAEQRGGLGHHLPQHPPHVAERGALHGVGTPERGVLAHRLADARLAAGAVVDVIAQLERVAQQLAEARPAGDSVFAVRAAPGGDGAPGGRGTEQRRGLLRVVGDDVDVGLQLQPLATDDAGARAGGLGQQAGHAQRRHRVVQGRARQRLEGQREQRVTHQDGGGLAECGVARGAAAAGVGVVERGQVVVDQRGAVHQLHRGRHAPHQLRVPHFAVALRHQRHQQRPGALAAEQHRFLHGEVQPGRRITQGRERAREPPVDEGARTLGVERPLPSRRPGSVWAVDLGMLNSGSPAGELQRAHTIYDPRSGIPIHRPPAAGVKEFPMRT